MTKFTLDHFHMFTDDVEGTALWYKEMFGARALRSLQSDGKFRVDLDFGVMKIYLAKLPDDSPRAARAFFGPLPGLEHLGFLVSDVASALEELRSKGVEVLTEIVDIRPDVRYAFVRDPNDVRIELLQRGPRDFAAEVEELGEDQVLPLDPSIPDTVS